MNSLTRTLRRLFSKKWWQEYCGASPPETELQAAYDDGYSDGRIDGFDEGYDTARIEFEVDLPQCDSVYGKDLRCGEKMGHRDFHRWETEGVSMIWGHGPNPLVHKVGDEPVA